MKPKKDLLFALVTAALLFLPAFLPAAGAQSPQVGISQPGGGEALQGLVMIMGTTGVEGFQSAEVSFAYQASPANTWFLIEQSALPVTENLLAAWDTTTITDGDYRLRLQVFLRDGRVLEAEVDGLRVRNYSPLETSTPVPTGESTATRQATPRPTRTPLPDFQVTPGTPVPLPTNPAVLSAQRLRGSALLGGLAAAGALLMVGLYAGLRSLLRR